MKERGLTALWKMVVVAFAIGGLAAATAKALTYLVEHQIVFKGWGDVLVSTLVFFGVAILISAIVFKPVRSAILDALQGYARVSTFVFRNLSGAELLRPSLIVSPNKDFLNLASSIERLNGRMIQLQKDAELGSNRSLLKETAEEVVSEVVSEDIGRRVEVKVEELISSALDDQLNILFRQILSESHQRLEKTSAVVTIRGFFNLMCGLCFAGIGIWFLIRTSSNASLDNLNSIVNFALTKLSITLLCVIVSYFFFSLYRSSLDDTKYYQNEISNIDFKTLAITLSMSEKLKRDDGLISALISEDRNCIIGKGAKLVSDTSYSGDVDVLKMLIAKIPFAK